VHAAADVWFVVDTARLDSDAAPRLNSSNKLVTAIGEFNNAIFAVSSYDFSEKALTFPQISGIASDVNKLSNALNEYRSTTVEVAFAAINDLDSRLENVNLSSFADVRSTEDKSFELKKLLFTGPFKP
jgi:hypothetical protein